MFDTDSETNYSAHLKGPLGKNDRGDGALPLPWFVLQTEPQAEFTALNRVAELPGIKPWLVLEVRTRLLMRHGRPVFDRGAHCREEVLRPFFPGYLLVSFDPAAEAYAPLLRWNRELRTRCLLCDDKYHPLALPSGAVAELQGQGRAGDGAIDLRRLPARLMAGDEVTVIAGPFADRRAVVGWTDQRRVEVLLGLLRVSLDRSQVG